MSYLKISMNHKEYSGESLGISRGLLHKRITGKISGENILGKYLVEVFLGESLILCIHIMI